MSRRVWILSNTWASMTNDLIMSGCSSSISGTSQIWTTSSTMNVLALRRNHQCCCEHPKTAFFYQRRVIGCCKGTVLVWMTSFCSSCGKSFHKWIIYSKIQIIPSRNRPIQVNEWILQSGGSLVVTCWTVDQEVVGSNPTHDGNLISVVRSLSGFIQPIR